MSAERAVHDKRWNVFIWYELLTHWLSVTEAAQLEAVLPQNKYKAGKKKEEKTHLDS